MNNKPRQIEWLLGMIATFIILHFLVRFGILAEEYNPVYDQLLISSMAAMCIFKLLDFHSKYKAILILGQIFFVCICILLYYAETWADYLTFFLCTWSDLRMLLYAKGNLDNMKEGE